MYMTTVKIDTEDDASLEKLRAKMILRGKKMTKKDIIGELIRKATKEEEVYTDDGIDMSVPLDKDPMWDILHSPDPTEITDTSTNVDEYLY